MISPSMMARIMTAPNEIKEVLRKMTRYEFAEKKAKAIVNNLVGAREVSKNKRKKLTRALLKQLLITDESTTNNRIRREVCFACGNFNKPVDVTAFYWLCNSCELKYFHETKTSTKTIKRYGGDPSVVGRGFRYYFGFGSEDRVEYSNDDTVIDGKLFFDDEPETVVPLGDEAND